MDTLLRLMTNQKGSAAIEFVIITALLLVSAIGALQALAANAATSSSAL